MIAVVSESPADKWDRRWREAGAVTPAPARVLVEHGHLAPRAGRALDLACGLGGSALWLARRGLRTEAWDVSPVAIERLAATAGAVGLTVAGAVRDVVAEPPEAAGFDVIVVSRFLERALAPALAAALTPGGLLFYQTFTREAVSDTGPADPAFRLAPNELLTLFPELRVLAYREEGRAGDTDRGWRDEALLVGTRRR